LLWRDKVLFGDEGKVLTLGWRLQTVVLLHTFFPILVLGFGAWVECVRFLLFALIGVLRVG
jgi:hypothetical protein